MTAARDEILARIRGALGENRPPVEPLHEPGRVEVDTDLSRLVERFADRVADYRATVVAVAAADVAMAVADACARAGVQRLAVPDGFDDAFLPAGVSVGGDPNAAGIVGVPARPGTRDDALGFTQVDALVAQAPLAIAETGTIIFDAGPGQGPRAASLLPDLLIAVVPASAIVDGVQEATTRMRETVRTTARPLTLVSGPSATSDIELDRVEGVHGPRTLEVVIVTGLVGSLIHRCLPPRQAGSEVRTRLFADTARACRSRQRRTAARRQRLGERDQAIEDCARGTHPSHEPWVAPIASLPRALIVKRPIATRRARQ